MEFDIDEFNFSFSRSSGPGGQNVNKVNSKVTLHWDINESSMCSEAVKERFNKKYSRYIKNGKVVIQSQKFKTQVRNKQDCLDKLKALLESVQKAPKQRLATKPTKSAVKKRLDNKKQHSEKKTLRSKKVNY